jgi:aminoglycoside phosphotransferase (APT) family kinase protein
MIDDLLDLLRREKLLPVQGQPKITPLTGGFWNDLFRLQDGKRDWVIKCFRASVEEGLYPILPASEALALETLRGFSIAPEPVGFIDEHGWQVLVYQFVEGCTWQDDVIAIARLLSRLHEVQVDPDRGFRQLALGSSDILAQGDRILAQADLDRQVVRLKDHRPDKVVRPPSGRLSLVHTDAWAGNFIQQGAEVRLIDWQCPGLGDAAEDVWTFIASGYEMLLDRPRFDQTSCESFLRAYADPLVIQRMRILSPFYAYRVASHCTLRQQQLAGDDPSASAAYLRVFTHLIESLGS